MARILLASADAVTVDVMTASLTAQGHEVLTAADGQDALERALANSPDLAFLDVCLPIFDGYETCRQMRNDPELSPRLPIFLLTAVDSDTRKLERAGATGFLAKGTAGHELADLLSRWLSPEALSG